MLTKPSDVRDRVPSGRFVRNLALSLSGGALLTLLGAGVAHANEAGTASDGSGAAGTGDATAVGNRSGTQADQGGTASTGGSNLQVINQNAGVANVGVAVANTGGNVAVGNASNNLATTGQTSVGGPLGLAVNNGNASNSSNGSALISTGDAYAIGNESGTTVDQRFDAQAHGALGGVVVLSQNAGVVNAGLGVANTGINGAVGNASGRRNQTPNTAGVLQLAQNTGGGAGGATNSGQASNSSDGKATISSGNASAAGNKATTTVSQVAGSGDGPDGDGSGLTVITQVGGALNLGVAAANTGVNGAVGNASSNDAHVHGPAPLGGGPDPQFALVDVNGIGLANNSASATNASDGTAWITTGDADAVGSESRTAIVQEARAELGDLGVNIETQLAPIVNVGIAAANTGVNGAVGNLSTNDADTDQLAIGNSGVPLDPALAFESAIVNNSGEAANSSNGSAQIHTGDARAQGNWSLTEVSQWTEATGDGLAVQTQAELVANVGIAVANSGVNGAIGNASQNDADVVQEARLVPLNSTLGLAIVNNSGSAANDSDGAASISTGAAWASGNESTTRVHQAIDPTGVAVQTQAALVLNAGVAAANSGINGAVGNRSDNAQGLNGAFLHQTTNLRPVNLVAGLVTASDQGEATNASDGSASITTGDARSVGNHSDTRMAQDATASVGGLGAVINTQVGGVANVGVAVANSGVNGAVGDESANRNELTQQDFNTSDTTTAGVMTSSSSGSVANASDGTASIATGDASARGNVSSTEFTQASDGSVPGLGIVVNTQVGGVLNGGMAVANSGGNRAVGNTSENVARVDQFVFSGATVPPSTAITTPVLTTSSSGEATNASDGSAAIATGGSTATGNDSETRFDQHMTGTVDGLGAVVNTQAGGVANLGLGVANSGLNRAVGNASDNNAGTPSSNGLGQGVSLAQRSDTSALGPITGANSGHAGTSSDGSAAIHTGDASAIGNRSATSFSQQVDGTVGEDGLGVVPNLQLGGVVNLGVGVANSGINAAVGNAADAIPFPIGPPAGDGAILFQNVTVASNGAPGNDPLAVAGPITASNAGSSTTTSSGSAKVVTGTATATGNVSSTTLRQRLGAAVDGSGLVVGPQVGVVANVGVAVANSGVNAAIGNLSRSGAASGINRAGFDPDDPTVVFGPVTVANQHEVSNVSDGDACVCTGNAIATGNVSTSTLNQDLDLGVDDGLSVVPMTGVILNAGFGLANSGVNLAIGNLSNNTALHEQAASLDPAAPTVLVGPQTIANGGGAANSSAGTGKVGTGNARADGNISTSDLTQEVDVDGAGAFALVNGEIGNVGLGVANAGVNAGIGNASTNDARVRQTATGSGTVANQGVASNRSDGFGGVGDPNCDVPGETPGAPGVPSLPKTGGPLEIEATVGLMLVLAGFATKRFGTRLARRA